MQTVLFSNGDTPRLLDGAHQPDGFALALAVPGVDRRRDRRPRDRTSTGRNVDPVDELGLDGPASRRHQRRRSRCARRGGAARHATGSAPSSTSASARASAARSSATATSCASNLFGHNAEDHGAAFGDKPCRCGRHGCLETVAAGWALPEPLGETDQHPRRAARGSYRGPPARRRRHGRRRRRDRAALPGPRPPASKLRLARRATSSTRSRPTTRSPRPRGACATCSRRGRSVV